LKFTTTTINLSKHPLLSKLIDEKDHTNSGTISALIRELMALLNVVDRKLEFKFANNTQGCLINVLTYTMKKGLLATIGRKYDFFSEAVNR
jgi:hypothetical protein